MLQRKVATHEFTHSQFRGDQRQGAKSRYRFVHRNHYRVVRLLHLRHCRCPGIRRHLLLRHSPERSRHSPRLHHTLGRLPRQADRRDHLRSPRRPDRTQEHSRHHLDDDGCRHGRHRTPPHLRTGRDLGADRSGHPSRHPRSRGRWRVGRRSAHCQRECTEGQEHPLLRVRPTGLTRRKSVGHDRVLPSVLDADAVVPPVRDGASRSSSRRCWSFSG